MSPKIPTRRQFLSAGMTLAGAGLIDLDWVQVAAAAEHADHMVHDAAASVPTGFSSLTAAEAVEIEAIASQIIPSGDMPGAREAGVVYFIDRAIGTFFASELPAFRKGLGDFQRDFAAHGSSRKIGRASCRERV